jgi:ribosomal protein L37E
MSNIDRTYDMEENEKHFERENKKGKTICERCGKSFKTNGALTLCNACWIAVNVTS